MDEANRTRGQFLRDYCASSGLKKKHIATAILGINPLDLSALLRVDLDDVIARLDRLQDQVEREHAA